jgi:NADPH-dependent sulfite reductase flavoprotein alpha-component
VLQVEAGRVTKVAGDKEHPANFGRLCTKGTTSAEVISDPGRMATASIRPDRHSERLPVPMDEAITAAAHRLRGIIDAHGPDAVALYVSGQMSLEAQYLATKLAKGFIGTNNIDSNSRLCMSSAASGYKLSLGADGPPGSYEDFDAADVFFVTGANMADCHPILFLRLLDRRKAGAKLIVADPRRTATAEKADLFLQLQPGTDLALLNGILHLLVENGTIDAAFIAAHTEGWADMPGFLADFSPARVAELTGLAEADIRTAADWIGGAKNWMSCWTMGLNQSTQGTWHTNAICNLHLATGAICRTGSGPFSLTGQPNAMGGREVGYLSHGLPGQRAVTNHADRKFTEKLWDIPEGTIRAAPGADALQIFSGLQSGAIKAVWIICTNPVASLPNRCGAIAGLQQAELVIAQDAYFDTETNAYADILLPGALWAEAGGVMINSERNMTLMQPAVAPPGEARADWRIIAQIACAMGFGAAFSYAGAAEIFDEIARTANPATGYDISGASHEKLRAGPLQWPIAPHGAARNPIRYGAGHPHFPTSSGRARFFARPALPPAELPDADYPFVLNTGRLPHQWHTMTKTGKSKTLNRLNPCPFVEINPQDAAALGIAERDMVAIRSRRGQAVLPVVITPRVLPGSCFAPFHWNDVFGAALAINAVTSDAVDALSRQPEFKFCAVALAKVAGLPTAGLRSPAAPPPGPAAAQHVTLLWASQTGNSEALAERTQAALTAVGLKIHAASMADYPPAELLNTDTVIIITSTYGDGEPPDNGRDFWAFLSQPGAPKLAHLRFAVCGLGNSSYDQFCQHGKNLDARLSALGATRLAARLDCDADDAPDLAIWLQPLTGARSDAAAVTPPPMGRNRPTPARLLQSRRLNAPGAGKDTRFIALSLAESGLRYEAGDALGIWPENCPELVDEVLALAGLNPDAPVTVDTAAQLPLRQALRQKFELTCPGRDMLDFIAARNGSTALQSLLGETRRDELKQWLWGKQLPDVLRAYPVAATPQEFVGALKQLQPRLYSIASSPSAHPGEVHLTVSAVRFGALARKGACSVYLAERAAGDIPVFVQRSAHFRLPRDPATPIIMIGPGTGIAPFRGFLHERRAQAAAGRNWLFFGEQHRATDFYYEHELASLRRDGTLTALSLAFSRDQSAKIYVQHRMVEEGAALWSWLQDGAVIYVCGDATHMAKDVEAALLTIAERHGGHSPAAARDFLSALTREKRYLRDVY